MRYVVSRLNEHMREIAYRIYVTDALKVLVGGDRRYYDYIDTTPPDTRTKEEIVDAIWSQISSD